jgi:uncharacterized membrane protein (GlpM family)
MAIFVIGLLLKIAMTATIVVAASVVVERSGPFVGSLIASLPTAGGAAMIILALEHPPEFIAQIAVGSLIANAACALFALSYAALAQRHSLWLSLGGTFLVWLTGADIAWRAGVVTFCVILVTAASNSIGSYFSGVFAFFPVAVGSFFIILHPRIGGLAAASVAAHVLTPLVGLGLSLLLSTCWRSQSGCGGPTQSACRSGLRGMRCFGLCVIGGCKKPLNAKGRVPAP